MPIGIVDTSPESNIPYTSPIFPLALLYTLACFVLFTVLYIVRIFVDMEGLVGYVGLAAFACVLLAGEVFTGNTDIFQSYLHMDLNQIIAVFLLAIGLRGIWKVAKGE